MRERERERKRDTGRESEIGREIATERLDRVAHPHRVPMCFELCRTTQHAHS